MVGDIKTDVGAERYAQRLAVSVVVFFEGRFLLVERGRDPGKGLYAFPGGKAEPGEPLESAARRELFEETGIIAGALTLITELAVPGSGGGFHLHVFQAADFSGVMRAGDDAASAGWYLIDELDALPAPQSVRDVAAKVSEASR